MLVYGTIVLYGTLHITICLFIKIIFFTVYMTNYSYQFLLGNVGAIVEQHHFRSILLAISGVLYQMNGNGFTQATFEILDIIDDKLR